MKTIWTIGFAGKTAEQFFGTLRRAGIKRLLDVRLRNTSQLAGFTKQSDLPFFLRELCDASYLHEPQLAPSPELFTYIKREGGSWSEYERRFLVLLAERQAEAVLDPASFAKPTVLLCTEPKSDRCHRRLVAEYLLKAWGEIEIVHL